VFARPAARWHNPKAPLAGQTRPFAPSPALDLNNMADFVSKKSRLGDIFTVEPYFS
jgi:hypothetical protein